jgi:molybdopterin/thiamine biosynthesis adenylyltransferase
MSIPLTDEDLVRYNRQIILPEFGEEGQKKLRLAQVLVAGVGGLGSPVAVYLACAGIGRLILADSESVELSNLNRQILHWEEDVGERKVASGTRKLIKLNSTVAVNPRVTRITAENVMELLDGVDLVVDCLDNMETRFIVNEACFQKRIPFIHGGVRGLMGEVTTIIPGQTPCLECLFPRGPEKKEPFPVFGATAALVASLQVMEAIKLLAGFGKLLAGRVLYINGSEMQFLSIQMKKNTECRICGSKAE